MRRDGELRFEERNTALSNGVQCVLTPRQEKGTEFTTSVPLLGHAQSRGSRHESF